MSDRKLKKFCRIMPWLQDQDPDLAGAIQDLCMEGQLSSRFGGVTFLYPAAPVRKKIVEATYGTDPEAAIDMVRAHIIPRCLTAPSDFTAEKLASKLDIEVGVESAAAGKVKLAGGAVLKPAKGFTPLRNDKICVWEVDSGAVPTEGPEFKMARKPKTSGFVGGGGASRPGQQMRRDVAARCLGEFAAALVSHGVHADQCYLRCVVTLLQFLKSRPDLRGDYLRALCAVDRNPLASFYILVEPYKGFVDEGRPVHEPYLSDRAITEWLSGPANKLCGAPASELLALFDDLTRHSGSSALAFSDPQLMHAQAVAISEELIENANSRIFPTIEAVYRQATTANAVGSASGVWPDEVAAALVPRKLWQDLIRFDLRILQCYQTQRQGSVDVSSVLDLLDSVHSRYPGNDYAAEVQSAYNAVGGGHYRPIGAADRAYRLCEFVRSWDFLYIPRPNRVVDDPSVPAVSLDEKPAMRAAPWPGDQASQMVLRHKASTESAGEPLPSFIGADTDSPFA